MHRNDLTGWAFVILIICIVLGIMVGVPLVGVHVENSRADSACVALGYDEGEMVLVAGEGQVEMRKEWTPLHEVTQERGDG